MNQQRTKDVLMHLSSKYNIPAWAIREMVEAQFDFLRKVIESGDRNTTTFEGLRLFRFGVFYVAPKKAEALKLINDRNKARNLCATECEDISGYASLSGRGGYESVSSDGKNNKVSGDSPVPAQHNNAGTDSSAGYGQGEKYGLPDNS